MGNFIEKVVVIGGGVIGAVSALYLREKGLDVTIVEKDRFGEGASRGNCGIVISSHVMPLNSFGTMFKGLKWMLKKDAPLFVHPRLDPDMFRWFFEFAGNSFQKKRFASAAGRAALLSRCVDEWDRLIREEGIECEWARKGTLYVFRDPVEWKYHWKTDSIDKGFGIGGRPVRPSDLPEFEPTLKKGMGGGWYYGYTGHLRPEALMMELERILLQKGVIIREKEGMVSFETGRHRATGIRTEHGVIEADAFVLATGAWTSLLQKEIGGRIPVQPGKGYSLLLKKTDWKPRFPSMLEEVRVAVTPHEDGVRLGGTMEFSGFDSRLNRRRIASIVRGASGYYADMGDFEVENEWCGFRPMTSDGLPIIDWSPSMNNVLVAAGHNMVGLSMAPATARLVTGLICGEGKYPDPVIYRFSRFTGR